MRGKNATINILSSKRRLSSWKPSVDYREVKEEYKGCQVLASRKFVSEELHHPSRPAFVYTDKDLRHELWYLNNEKHRENGPAEIVYREDKIIEEKWYKEGKLHREKGPAEVITDEDKKEITKTWYKQGKLHNSSGPAVLITNFKNEIIHEAYYQNGISHREDGPARIFNSKEEGSQTISKAWKENGEYYRSNDQPAVVSETHLLKVDAKEITYRWPNQKPGDKYYKEGYEYSETHLKQKWHKTKVETEWHEIKKAQPIIRKKK